MNRREVLSAMTAMCGAAGVTARMDVVTADQPVTLAVIHCEKPLPPGSIEALHRSWNRLRELHPDIPPCAVIESGIRLELK